jgi:hypothetical protein
VYTYSVKATTAAGDSALSAVNTGWRNVPAPVGVSATDGTFTTKVRISWSAVVGATGYNLYRRLPGEPDVQLATIPGGSAVSHDDTSIPANVVGLYFVRAFTAAGVSTASTSDSGFRGAGFLMTPPSTQGGTVGKAASSQNQPGVDGTLQASDSFGGVRATAAESAVSLVDRASPQSGRTPDGTVGGALDAVDQLEHYLDCAGVIARIKSRLRFLDSVRDSDLGLLSEADWLRALLLEPSDFERDAVPPNPYEC